MDLYKPDSVFALNWLSLEHVVALTLLRRCVNYRWYKIMWTAVYRSIEKRQTAARASDFYLYATITHSSDDKATSTQQFRLRTPSLSLVSLSIFALPSTEITWQHRDNLSNFFSSRVSHLLNSSNRKAKGHRCRRYCIEYLPLIKSMYSNRRRLFFT